MYYIYIYIYIYCCMKYYISMLHDGEITQIHK